MRHRRFRAAGALPIFSISRKDLRQSAVDKGTALRAKLAEHRAQVAEEEKVQAPAAPKPAPTADSTRDEGDEPQAYVP